MTTPAWHEEAKQLFADGFTISAIAKRVERSRSTVAWVVDYGNARQRHRERVRVQRRSETGPEVRHRVTRTPAPEPPPAPLIEASRKPTLPHISMPAIPDEPIVLKFAPRTRITSSPGAERWRFHNLKMIREGRIPAPGLPEQLHH